MNRAERRRMDREAGTRRAAKKKGRRPRLRRTDIPEEADFTTLEKAGFVVGQPKILMPGEK